MKDIHKKKTINHIKYKVKTQISFGDLLKRFFVVWFLMFFCALVITQQESFWLKTSSSPDQVVFVLPGTPADWGVDTVEVGTHGAAGDWDYLFQDTSSSSQTDLPPQDVSQQEPSFSQGETNNSSNNQIPSSSVEKDFLPPDTDSFPKDEQDIISESPSSGTTLISTTSGNTITSGSQTGLGLVEQICITAWGESVAPGDFVLAYEQRKDVTNLCNVQRRYCNNGKLTGSYSQKSCKEHTLYSYVKPEAISSTQKPFDSFVQPTSPTLNGADFDTHGKINGTTDPIDTWGSPSSGRPTEDTSISQDLQGQIKCITPWGESVVNGQFVKAYKSAVGLIDMPCDVEIRLCVKGKLKGSYTHRTCTFKKMTYRDYLIQNYNQNEPTMGDLINTLNTEETETTYSNSSFWKRLDKYF